MAPQSPSLSEPCRSASAVFGRSTNGPASLPPSAFCSAVSVLGRATVLGFDTVIERMVHESSGAVNVFLYDLSALKPQFCGASGACRQANAARPPVAVAGCQERQRSLEPGSATAALRRSRYLFRRVHPLLTNRRDLVGQRRRPPTTWRNSRGGSRDHRNHTNLTQAEGSAPVAVLNPASSSQAGLSAKSAPPASGPS